MIYVARIERGDGQKFSVFLNLPKEYNQWEVYDDLICKQIEDKIYLEEHGYSIIEIINIKDINH